MLNSSISCSLIQGSSDEGRNEDISNSTSIDDTKRRKRSNTTQLSYMQQGNINCPRVPEKKVRPKKIELSQIRNRQKKLLFLIDVNI